MEKQNCTRCKKEFENGDLVLVRGSACLHAYSSNGSDDFDCDYAYSLEQEMKKTPVESGFLEIFYNGNYYMPKEILKLPHYKELKLGLRPDMRGSRIVGNLEGLSS